MIFYFLLENGEDEPCSGLCYVMKLEKLARQLELSAKQKVETLYQHFYELDGTFFVETNIYNFWKKFITNFIENINKEKYFSEI